ncbi:hypothetical protein [Cognatishimia sp. MH4019]|uniref:hypothetical protein n=1 Tax=Cognatishimia sp. MH4019 TaxID=2854030 RepID=UPI001CD73288|nr:hypothetical protein [Cognatishimia sp. MH4019]
MRLMLFMTVFSIGLFGAVMPLSQGDKVEGVQVASLDAPMPQIERKTKRVDTPEIEPGSFEAALFSAVTGSGPILDQSETRLMHNPNSCGLGTHGAKVRESLLGRNTLRSVTGAKRVKAPKRKAVIAAPDAGAPICGVFSREAGCTPIVTAALNKWVLSGNTPSPALADEKPQSDREKSVRSLLCKHG